jgi:hypothetical protein
MIVVHDRETLDLILTPVFIGEQTASSRTFEQVTLTWSKEGDRASGSTSRLRTRLRSMPSAQQQFPFSSAPHCPSSNPLVIHFPVDTELYDSSSGLRFDFPQQLCRYRWYSQRHVFSTANGIVCVASEFLPTVYLYGL